MPTDPEITEKLENFSWNGSLTPEQAIELCRAARNLPGLPHSQADGGFYVPTRYDDVITVMDDPGTFSSAPSVFRPIAEEQPPFPALEYDPPHHKEWRILFRELVNPRTAKVLEPQVRADVDARIDRFIGHGESRHELGLRFFRLAAGGYAVALLVSQCFGKNLAVDSPAAIEVRAAFE